VRLAETPPHLVGTSFGYHFTNPRILELRMTLPRGKRSPGDPGLWARWRHSEGEVMERSQSARGERDREENGSGARDWASEDGFEERRRGASVV
jgi:hypothetical protein